MWSLLNGYASQGSICWARGGCFLFLNTFEAIQREHKAGEQQSDQEAFVGAQKAIFDKGLLTRAREGCI